MNLVLSLSLNLGIILVKFPLYCFFEENLSSMPLGIPQKKKKKGGVCGTLLGGTWLPYGDCGSIDSKHPFTGTFRKDNSICNSRVENHYFLKKWEVVSC